MRLLDLVTATRRRRIAALGTTVAMAGVCALVVTMGFGRAETGPGTVATISKSDLGSLIEAAASCPALTPAKLAGQIMAESGFVASRASRRGGAGIAGLTEKEWITWAPWPGASRDDSRASVLGLAHLMCDLAGQIRVAKIAGDPWRLALDAYDRQLTTVTAGNPPRETSSYVQRVVDHAVRYALHPDFGGPGVTLAAPPPRPADPSDSPSPTPSPTASRSADTGDDPPTSAPPVRTPESAAPRPEPTTPRAQTTTPKAPPTTPRVTTPPAQKTTFTLVNKKSNRCLSATPGMDGTQLTLQNCDGSAPQNWTRMADGTIRGVNGLCMDAANGDTGEGTRVQVAWCNGHSAQQFYIDSHNQVVSRHANKCLDAYDGGTTAGTRIILWTCRQQGNQTFYVR